MAESSGVLERLVVALGFTVDDANLRRFDQKVDATKTGVARLGGQLTAAAGGGMQSLASGAVGLGAALARGVAPAADAAGQAAAGMGVRLAGALDPSRVETMTAAMGGLKAAALGVVGAVGALAGGIGALVSRVANGMDEVGDFAALNGLTAREVAAFDKVAAENDVEMQGMRSSLASVNRMLGEVSLGVGRSGAIFEKLGISAKDSSGEVKTASGFLGEVADRISKMQSLPEQAAFLEKLGIDRSALNILKEGRTEYARLLEDAQAANPFSEDDFELADRTTKLFAKAGNATKLFARQIGVALMPQVNRALEAYLDWWKATRKVIAEPLARTVQLMASALGTAVDWIVRIVGAMKSMVDFLSRLTGGTNVLLVALGALVAYKVGVWAIAAAGAVKSLAGAFAALNLAAMAGPLLIGALLIALGLAIDDFMVWREGGKSLFGDWLGGFDAFWQGFAAKHPQLMEWLQGWAQAANHVRGAIATWTPVLAGGLEAIDTFIGATQKRLLALVGELPAGIARIKEVFSALQDGALAVFDRIRARFAGVVDAIVGAVARVRDAWSGLTGAPPAAPMAPAPSVPGAGTIGAPSAAAAPAAFAAPAPLGRGPAALPPTGAVTQTTNVSAPITIHNPDPEAAGRAAAEHIARQQRAAIRNQQGAVER